MESIYNKEMLQAFIEHPHLLGHLLGKDKLLPLHSEWIKYCWDSDTPRALMSFRGGYKTTAIDVVGIVRWFLLRPNERIALIRKSFNDASTVVSSVQQAMNLPEVKELFKFAHGFYPKATMARNGKLRYNFKTTVTPEANLTAHGIDGSLTGYHYDKIICDDIITLKDRISRAERTRTAEAVNEIATNIIDPGKGSIWIGTPWHKEDAWNEINKFTDIAMYPIQEYNFLGEEAIKKKRETTTPFLFACNYELEVRKDESSLFTDPLMAEGWDYSKRAYAQIDAAFDGNHYCALSIIAPLDGPLGQAKEYQAVGFTYPGNVKSWVKEVARICKRYKVQYIFNETNPDKGYLAEQLKGEGLRVKTYFERQNKHIKIASFLYEFWTRLYWSPDTDPEFMNQVLDYREGSEPDDAPDSIASLLREAVRPHMSRSTALYTL